MYFGDPQRDLNLDSYPCIQSEVVGFNRYYPMGHWAVHRDGDFSQSALWLGLAVPVLGFTTSAQVECLRIITPPNPKPCRKTQLLTCIESFGLWTLCIACVGFWI